VTDRNARSRFGWTTEGYLGAGCFVKKAATLKSTAFRGNCPGANFRTTGRLWTDWFGQND
jgi:hypothetical protein